MRLWKLLVVVPTLMASGVSFAADSLWITPKVQLRAEVSKATEWDLTAYLKDKSGKIAEFESKNLPTGFSIDIRKKGANTFAFLKTPAITKEQKLTSFHITAYSSTKVPSVSEFIVTVVAKEAAKPVAQGGTYPRLPRPINLPAARAGQPYSASIANLVVDTDPGDTFTFKWLSGSEWLKVSPTGAVTATSVPLNVVGTEAIRVEVTDSFGLKDNTLAFIEVTAANEAPRWEFNGQEVNEISLGDVEQGRAMNFDLSLYANDPDGDLIIFTVAQKARAPWFSVRAEGIANGKPTAADSTIGQAFSVVLYADDGTDKTPVVARGRIVAPNNDPVIAADPIKIVINERETWDKSLVTEKLVTDKDGDKLTFTLQKPAPEADYAWINMKPDGNLKIVALHEHANKTFDFKFTVTDNKIPTPLQGNIQVVVLRNPLPPQWVKPRPFEFTITAGQQFSEALAGYAKDFEGLDITYELKASTAKWLNVENVGEGNTADPKPRLFGRPLEANVGDFTATLVAKNDHASSPDAKIILHVLSGNSAPKWTLGADGKVTLAAATVDTFYNGTVTNRVTDSDPADKGKLKFRFTHLDSNKNGMLDPAETWIFVSPQGAVFGDPEPGQTTPVEVEVTVVDTKGASATATVVVPFKGANTPPTWVTGADGLVDLGSVAAGSSRTVDLSLPAYVTDPDDAASNLRFKKLTARPSWANLTGGQTSSQLLLNPPAGTAAQEYVAAFSVTDQQGDPVEVGLKITVTTGGGGTNRAPVVQNPIVLSGRARTVLDINLNQEPYAKDEDGDAMQFSWASPDQIPTWLRLIDGHLVTTSASVEGTVQYDINVTDGKAVTPSKVRLTLTAGGTSRPPIWIYEPLPGPLAEDQEAFKIKAGESVTINVLGDATRPKQVESLTGARLYFAKSTDCNVGWITLSTEGILRISPLASISGRFTCDVIASDNPAFNPDPAAFDRQHDARGKIMIDVTETVVNSQVYTAKLSERPSSGTTPAEILFVVDNHTRPTKIVDSNGFISYMDRSIRHEYYFNLKARFSDVIKNLDNWGVDYRIGVISARDFSGKLLYTPGTSPIMRKGEMTTDQMYFEFHRRLDLAKNNCNDVSGFLSAAKFFDNVTKTYPKVVESDFMQPNVPLFVYFFAHEKDQYKNIFSNHYSGSMPEVKELPEIFYDRSATKWKKPVLVYVEDHSTAASDSKTTYNESFYNPIIAYNHGQYLSPSNGGPTDESWMLKFTEEVTWQSRRFRKRSVDFTEATYNVSQIRVFIEYANNKSIELTGNTGKADDQWSFVKDTAKKTATLRIHWWNIRIPYSPDTDKLVIRY